LLLREREGLVWLLPETRLLNTSHISGVFDGGWSSHSNNMRCYAVFARDLWIVYHDQVALEAVESQSEQSFAEH